MSGTDTMATARPERRGKTALFWMTLGLLAVLVWAFWGPAGTARPWRYPVDTGRALYATGSVLACRDPADLERFGRLGDDDKARASFVAAAMIRRTCDVLRPPARFFVVGRDAFRGLYQIRIEGEIDELWAGRGAVES